MAEARQHFLGADLPEVAAGGVPVRQQMRGARRAGARGVVGDE